MRTAIALLVVVGLSVCGGCIGAPVDEPEGPDDPVVGEDEVGAYPGESSSAQDCPEGEGLTPFGATRCSPIAEKPSSPR